jgi:ribosomal protein S18 acetylase RimI-like enzyme
VELGTLGKGELNNLLEEEIATWRQALDWDFGPTADIVRRFADLDSLSGLALITDGRVAGYLYYVAEEHKGLIGDIFIAAEHRSYENENLLLASAIELLVRRHNVRRVESQMMLQHYPRRVAPPFADRAVIHERKFMMFDAGRFPTLPPKPLEQSLRFDHWQDRYHEDAARAIAAAYRGHVDGEINDQYRHAGGARRFLLNIVQYPGCGSFRQNASWLAWLREGSMLCGLSLASSVARDVGHLTQVCVVPGLRGAGAGYELVRRSLVSLMEDGCRAVSLTVTASNTKAVGLYERMGFQTRRTFPAIVWDRL